MLNIVAPLDYERWAVLVNPLLVPSAVQVEAKSPPRQAEQLGAVNAALNGTSSRAGEGLREPISRSMGLGRNSIERNSASPLTVPPPTDLNWFFQLPGGARGSMQDRPAIDPQKVAELYVSPETAPSTTLSVLG